MFLSCLSLYFLLLSSKTPYLVRSLGGYVDPVPFNQEHLLLYVLYCEVYTTCLTLIKSSLHFHITIPLQTCIYIYTKRSGYIYLVCFQIITSDESMRPGFLLKSIVSICHMSLLSGVWVP